MRLDAQAELIGHGVPLRSGMFVDALVLHVQQALSPKERAQQCTLVVMVRNDRGGKTAVQRIIAQPQPQSQPQQQRQRQQQGRAYSRP